MKGQSGGVERHRRLTTASYTVGGALSHLAAGVAEHGWSADDTVLAEVHAAGSVYVLQLSAIEMLRQNYNSGVVTCPCGELTTTSP